MREQIKSLLDEGKSRHQVFEHLKPDSRNKLRLAKQIATYRDGKASGLPAQLNRLLLITAVLQSGLAIGLIYKALLPVDKGFSELAIAVILILTVLYVIGLARMTFTGYASFLTFCIGVAGTYVYGFPSIPVEATFGIVLALVNAALTHYLKARLFPHMGMMDVRKDDQGNYIFE